MIPKFRAWVEAEETMHSVLSLDWSGIDDNLTVFVPMGNTSSRAVSIDNAVLMQSTGLFDKNGKEIFEGDVVVVYDELIEFGPGVYEVVYSQDNLAWTFYDKENHDFCYILTCTWDELEIIGNAHQNPELLEATND
ncbi:TPA: hypothetical protein U1405_000791 [Streptococcus suis]|uniref:YopX family protein n=1 Tax=Streptococcus suis TaxID=1307 RepID=UPI000416B167|nr:YopX family protein [Streptococcus suis]MDW8593231.1 YopX family protein [Streptococcus suis]MDW8622658.1 YopX family protein [Streptococcus suis]NQJ99900.1 hypothetical protein [Streptococcus suis]NQK14429.1 hypothetical protein [Streptococcus suis]NQL33593.1 hypothetical protein [Streptococcus suis]